MTETVCASAEAATLPSAAELGEIVEQVWSSFLDGPIVLVPGGSGDDTGTGKIVAWVAISGDWKGHLIVTAGPACALQIAAGMFQMESGEVSTAEVADALGEIANMVGGSVKGMVDTVGTATLSLPQVVLDASALISPDAHLKVGVDAEWNGHSLEFSLWEKGPAR